MVLQNTALGAELVPRSLSERSRAPFLQMFDGLWILFGTIFPTSYKIVYGILAIDMFAISYFVFPF